MDLALEGIVVIVGNYGSGKSEVAVNLAIHHRRRGRAVRIADLDLVNPYFRSREAERQMAALGIEVVLPPRPYVRSELPVLAPTVGGLIRAPGELAILDVGGNNVGAMVLAALGDAFAGRRCRVMQVVNPYRPETSDSAGCERIRQSIEAAARLPVTDWIGNANLIDETTPRDIVAGYEFMRGLADATGIPIAFVTAPERLLSQVDTGAFRCPVLPIRRQLVPPWRAADAV